MTNSWKTTRLSSVEQVIDVLLGLKGKQWLSRGQAKSYERLVPSIDRGDERCKLSRGDKLMLERQGIDIFRSTARFFAGTGEQGALVNDVIALMVLRHYGVPTRLLDWSRSPYVATYFAVCCHDKEDGEIWSFDEPEYERVGQEQWGKWPETTSDGSGDPSKFTHATAFALEEPPDWFICAFYSGFPRQDAQAGAYTMTARFCCDHADAIARLLMEDSRYHRYVISAELKPKLRAILREKHGVWRGSLYPDSAGAAETALGVFKSENV